MNMLLDASIRALVLVVACAFCAVTIRVSHCLTAERSAPFDGAAALCVCRALPGERVLGVAFA